MLKLKKILASILFLLYIFLFPPSVKATIFDLYPSTPTPYVTGQEIVFTITINTEGQTLTNTAIGLTYNTQHLRFINALPGSTFSTITTDNLGDGKLIFYGQANPGFNGQGKYVDVIFRIIGSAPGTTELCALWNPEEPPLTPTPTLNITHPTQSPISLPRSGETNKVKTALVIGLTTLAASSILMVSKKSKSN